jgi:hydrogenase maturation protease
MTTARTVVIGLGGPDRADDAVGPAVASAVGALAPAGIDVVTHEDPTALVHLWADAELAVVVDAVVSGRAPGTVTTLEVGRNAGSLPTSAWSEAGRGGTHAFGLAAAVELARALKVLPERVVLIGVEAASFEHGEPMTGAVAAAVDAAAAKAMDVVVGAVATGGA